MKIRSIQIERFTAFHNVYAEFCPGLNVLVGANATGKTHLLKILYASLKTLARGPRGDTPADQRALATELRTKLEAVFRPQDDRSGRLVRRRPGSTHARFGLECSDGQFAMELTTLGRLTLDKTPLPSPEPSLFLPARELLAGYEGFIEAYQARAISSDDTYYDLAVALSAEPLRGPPGDRAAFIDLLNTIVPFKVVLQNGRFYISAPGQGKIEAHLVAEGYRKIASLIHLVNNGALAENHILFWDEPTSNLNPQHVLPVARFLLMLAATEMQIFVATHDFLLVEALSRAVAEQQAKAEIRFLCVNRPAKGESLEFHAGSSLTELSDTPIVEEFTAHYGRPRGRLQGRSKGKS